MVVLADAVADVISEFGGDGTGFDGADPHVLPGQFLSECFAEGGDGELGGRVDGGAADGLTTGHGTDVDHVGHASRGVPCGGGR